MKKFNTCIVLAFAILLAACSSLRLAYNNGDTLLYWWLDAYVDFDSEQKSEVKQDIGEFFRWHRKTQLQDYVQFLQKAQHQLRGNPTQADLMADYVDIRDRTEALLLRSAPEIAELALSLKPDQLEGMEKKFAKNNAKFRKENMKGDAQDQNKFRYKKSMEQFELWFGDFSDEQEAIIRKASDARPLNNALWLDERMRRQLKIMNLARKIMKEQPSKQVATQWIEELIRSGFDRFGFPERKAFFDSYTQGTLELVHTVVRISTPEQKAHAQKRMEGWIKDLNTLAAQVH
ncbi:hypothetical protein SAMN05518865_102118 [Duganella sp. CF458]|uniref:DUF6279 family lipoprotein n=1 Tax=Duganella sp. CF458 TaxID=1884368 RepID=UPI0008E2D111|nr:DUF6279 family lipoprotein [Duganella sp. CF458]SFF60620.1 hypothetical protein SAMN05518865_102118 [Duganella sp. CF458]